MGVLPTVAESPELPSESSWPTPSAFFAESDEKWVASFDDLKVGAAAAVDPILSRTGFKREFLIPP